MIDGEGSATELVPINESETSIQVLVPGSVAAGNYRVVVVKQGSESNPMSLIIKPEVVIKSAVCRGTTLSVNGSGFGDYSNASNSGTSVSVSGETGRVIAWSDKEILAQASGCSTGEVVTVNSVHGSTTATVD